MVHRSSAQATALPQPRLSGLPSPPLAELAKLKADSNLQLSARSAPVEQEALLPILQESPLAGLVMRPDLPLPQLREVAKRSVPSDSELLVHLALAKRKVPLAIRRLPEQNPLAGATRLLWEAANLRLLEDLDLRQTERRLALVRLPEARPRLQDLGLRRVERFPVQPVRARQCSKDPGPYAFSRGIPVAQKYNRAVRCGGRPTSVRYRRPRNRRGLAGYDNRCSRSQRKRAHPVRPFRIAAEDKRRCRPLPFADRDVRFANSG